MKGRQKGKKKGGPKERVFGCDLDEHLQYTGQDVPQVLKSCTDFVEEHGIVDGIYRLSGISSNIQRLRQEFDTEKNPDLNKDVYLQDIHCISSLCKAYFRELPNPLLTYQLYDKFAEAVSVQLEEERLVKIKDVLKELLPTHYRTLEYLMKHLVHMASFSSQTNMHARNLAIVWAPNLLRSKDIEASGFNGTAAFMEVRVQSIVVEFILTHVEQLFEDKDLNRVDPELRRKAYSPPSFPPITIATSEEMYFRTNVPSILTPGDGPAQMRPYHTILELTDQKRKGSVKVKKWKSIFNLGRSINDSKRKSKEGKDEKTDKLYLRPAKSMDSLSSMPCASDDQDGIMLKRSSNTTPYRHESFGPQSKEDEKSKTSDLQKSNDTEDQQPVDVQQDSKDGKTHEKIKSESEPNTPKPNRSHIITSPQGRSPKANRNRAEKCAGVHISGPFSVTVPYHITSTLTLSSLASGRFLTDISDYVASEKEISEQLDSKEEQSSCHEVQNKSSAKKEEMQTHSSNSAEGEETKKKAFSSTEDILDQFSFLDSQEEVCFDTSFAESEPVTVTTSKASSTVKVAVGVGWAEGTESTATARDENTLDDDMGPAYMNDIMNTSMQIEEFSVEPPLDADLYEPTTDDQGYTYYMAHSFPEKKSPFTEDDDDCNSEEIFLSAHDILDSLMKEEIFCTTKTNEKTMGSSVETTLDEMNKQEVHESSDQVQDRQAETTDAIQEDSSPKAAAAIMEIPECSDEPEVSKLPAEPMTGNSVTLDTIPQLLHLQLKPSPEIHSDDTGNSFMPKLHSEDCSDTKENRECHVAEMPAEEEKNTSAAESNKQYVCLKHQEMQISSLGSLTTEEDSEVIRFQQQESPQGQNCSDSGCSGLSGSSQCHSSPEQLTYHNQRADIGESVNKITDASTLSITECTSVLKELPLQQTEEQYVQSDVQLSSQEPAEVLTEETYREFYNQLELTASNISEQPPLFNNCNSNQLETFFIETPKEKLSEHTRVSFDNGVRMRLTSSKIRVHNVKAVPVVPPKPQFAKLPPALKSKFQVNAPGSSSGDGSSSPGHSPRASKVEELNRSDTHSHSGEHAAAQKQMRRSSWRNTGSKSFDTAVTSIKDRQLSQIPVRRMQTFCSGDSHEILGLTRLDRPYPLSKPLKPLSPGTRSSRPQSYLGPPSPLESLHNEYCRPFATLRRQTSYDAVELSTFEPRQDSPCQQEIPTRNRLSMPKISHKSDFSDVVPILPQRRSLAFEIKDSKPLD